MEFVKKIAAIVMIVWQFFKALLASSLGTLWIILCYAMVRKHRPNPIFIRFTVPAMSDWGLSLLGAMITLTPGTTTIDINNQEYTLLLHVLDGRYPEQVIAGINKQFIPPLLILFAKRMP